MPNRLFTKAVNRTYPRFEPELRHLNDFCPNHGTALDIGAWYGPWTIALANRLNRVISFEPNRKVAQHLSATAPPNVRVIQAAATDHTGNSTLWVPGIGMGTEALASMNELPDAQAVTVPTTTIDTLDIPDVTFVKLDVEGSELPALRGARTTLTTHHPTLLIELEYRRGPVDEVLAYLADLGYTPEILTETWRPLADFDLETHQRQVAPKLHGYLRTITLGGPRYINNVLFRAR